MMGAPKPVAPLVVGIAVIVLLLPLIIFLVTRLQIPGDGTQATFDLAQIQTTGFVVKAFVPSPDGLLTGDIVQAVEGHSLDDLARDVFHCDPDNLDVETVIQKIEETNTCENLDPPVRVRIDQEGWFSVLVYEEKS